LEVVLAGRYSKERSMSFHVHPRGRDLSPTSLKSVTVGFSPSLLFGPTDSPTTIRSIMVGLLSDRNFSGARAAVIKPEAPLLFSTYFHFALIMHRQLTLLPPEWVSDASGSYEISFHRLLSNSRARKVAIFLEESDIAEGGS